MCNDVGLVRRVRYLPGEPAMLLAGSKISKLYLNSTFNLGSTSLQSLRHPGDQPTINQIHSSFHHGCRQQAHNHKNPEED